MIGADPWYSMTRRPPAPAMTITLVVLAAGLSTRYGHGLKQLEAVGPNGEALVDYAVYDATHAGITRIVFIVRREVEAAFWERVARLPAGVEGTCVVQALEDVPAGFGVPPEREKPWGTGHAVLSAARAVAGPFVVANADDFYGAAAYRAVVDHLRQHATDAPPCFAVVGYRLRDTVPAHGAVSRAVCRVDASGFVTALSETLDIRPTAAGYAGRTPDGERVSLRGDELVSMSLWGFTPAIFPVLEEEFARFLRARGHDRAAEFLLPDAVTAAVASGRARLAVLPAPSAWCGITSHEDRETVRRYLAELAARGEYPDVMAARGRPSP
jgi:hypothetical protein